MKLLVTVTDDVKRVTIFANGQEHSRATLHHAWADVKSGCEGDISIKLLTEAVQPVVHAKWIPYGRDTAHTRFMRCSNCNNEVPIYEDADEINYKYCHNCGAKMDKEKIND